MNLVGYIDKYGKRSFNEFELTNIDYLVFAVIAYLDFDGIVSSSLNKSVILNDAIDMYFNKYDAKYFRIQCTAARSAIKVLKALKDIKRYKNVEISGYRYECSHEYQFSAMTFNLGNNKKVIAFEGTDDLISGWREDFEMSYKFPIPAEVMARKYINDVIKLFDSNEYTIVGHSKGGTLALYGSMYCDLAKQKKITNIYSFDGPGLWKKHIESWRYKKIYNRYHHIVPDCSIVGRLFEDKKYTVIKSNKVGLLGHDAFTWMLKDDDFLYTKPQITSNSFQNAFNNWYVKYNDEDRKLFTKQLFDVFDKCNITSTTEINAKMYAYVFDLVNEIKNISPESKEIMNSLLKFMLSDTKVLFLDSISSRLKKVEEKIKR